jgi:hypothetical protein
MTQWADEEPVPAQRFTDEEMAFLRHVRFGELPARVAPTELVETVETEQPPLPTRQVFDLGVSGAPCVD